MAKLYNLARMTTATSGTGTITLGSAATGFLTFAQAGVSNGETVTYAISDGSNSEIGRGVYTSSGTTLTRTVLKSTNSNSAISLSGSAEVFITVAKEDIQDAALGYVISGNGVTLQTGVVGTGLQVPFDCTITSWTLLADQSGSVTIDIWKDTYANFPPTVGDTITASAKPSITTATKNTSSTLTGWTTSVTAGDVLYFNVDSVTSITNLTIILKVAKV